MNQPPGLGPPPNLPPPPPGLGGGQGSGAGGPPPGLGGGNMSMNVNAGGGGGVPPGLVPPPPPGLGLPQAQGGSNGSSPMPPPPGIQIPSQGQGQGQVQSPHQSSTPQPPPQPQPLNTFAHPLPLPTPSIGPSLPPPTHGHHSHNSGGSVSTIVKAQIVFLLSTLTEESYARNLSEIRQLIGQNSPEMYYHFLRRLIVVAAPVLQSLQSQVVALQGQAQGQAQGGPPGLQGNGFSGDRPLSGSLNVPPNGAGVLAWRVLQSEGVRAARDASLAPHFATTLLVPHPPSTNPSLSLNYLQLTPNQLYSFASNAISNPSIILPESPIYTRLRQMIIDHYESVCASLRNPSVAFFPNEEDITLVDARTFILATYPRIQEEGGPDILDRSKKAPPRAVLPLNSIQRAQLLQLISVRFSSPVIILQALPSISPGGVPDEAQTSEDKVIPLSSFLFELGESLTADEGLVASVIARWWNPILENKEEGSMEVEVEVARTIGMLVAGVEDEGRSIDIGGVVRGLTGIANVDWANVIREFDQPQTALTRPNAQGFLQAIIENAPTSPSSAVDGLLSISSRWSNTLTLLKILDNLVAIPSDRLSLSLLPMSARLVTDQDFADLAPAVQALSGSILNNSWNIRGLTQVLAFVSRDIQGGRIRGKAEIEGAWEAVLEKGMKSASDLILLGFSMAEKPWSEAISSIVGSLLAMFIKGQPTSQLVMSVLGRTQSSLLVEALQRNYEENEMNVVRVVECGQDAQILDKLLSGQHNALALDVASIASKRDLIDLESWVTDGINKGGDVYIQAVLEYLDRKANAERSAIENTPETTPLSPAVYATYFRALRNSDRLNEDDIGHFKEVRNLCLQLHPRLLNLNPDADEEPGLQVVSFPAEIDAQVDDFYQRMYGEEITLDYVIDVLKRLKKSDLQQDHQLFACMLHTLFDEYKFVHTYPPRELAMTGLLFGSIIQYRLVEGTSLHVAVRYVLDALQSPPESTMFSFGRNALNIFQSRLPEFPLMCRALLDIPHLHESSPVLMSIIRTALTDPGMDGEGGSRPSSPEQIVFPALRVEELDQDEPDNRFSQPDEAVSDRILFIVNNLAPSNFEEKAAELKSILQSRYSRWFADYLVNTRVSVEPNNHGLYWQLMQTLDMPVLEKHVLWETYRKSSSLLNAEKTLDNSQDKSVLKNMASWLGKQTVARDLPVKHVHLALKDLLIQGYDEKRLQVAIPFVCKLMEHCSKSRVFHPPNPWLVAVMKLLSELYQFAELKLNLKFEIEVLCKSLDMNLAEIEATNILRSRTPPVPPSQPARLAQELDRITMPSNAGYMGQGPDQGGRGAQNPKDAAQQAAQDAFLRRVDELINQLPAQLIFSPGYPMFQSTTALKRIVLHSIDRALREIISPVVERSVTIAGISSRDLLMKDFGMESDDVKLRQAAHLMVSKLAGSLALVTCKEPLRTSMVNNIRTMMLQTGFSEENLPEQAIAGVVQDNLDVACNIIKTASQEKAVKDIDVNLSPAYAARRKQREAGQLFFDPSAFTNIVSRSALPESLRLTPHGLQVQQVRVYEDFGDQSRFTASVNQLDGDYPAAQVAASAPEGMVNGTRDHAAGTPLGEVVESSIMTTKLTAPQSMDKFQELVMELDKHLQRNHVDSLGHLPLHHDVKMIIRQIPVIATQSAHTDQTALSFSQKIVQLLYKSDSNIGREVWVSILQRLCDLFPKAAKEVTQWLVYAEDIRKFNVPVTITLIRAGLINLVEYDPQTAKMIYREFALPVVDFAALLIHEALFDEPACAGRAQFSSTIEALGRAAANRRGTPAVARLLDDLSRRNDAALGTTGDQSLIKGMSPQLSRPPVQEPPGSQSIDPDLRATLSIHFLEWVRLFTSPLPVDTTFVPFVNRLQKQGILKGEEVSSAFYRNSIALAIDIFSQHKASGSPQMYTGVDALSKLIVLLLKNYSDTHGVASDSAKTLYFAKIFTIAALSLVRDHEDLGADFEQRPYFRFFSSLLYDLQSIQSSFPQAYMGCLSTFANHLGSIQPAIAPAFAYSWISLISHRYFMPRLLQAGNKDGWTDFYRLLMALFKFLNPFLEAANFHQASRIVFKGALRILLVVLKDFPEFLVEHYIGLCAAIPAHCIQLRNVVLCAFPRDVTIRLDIHSLSEVPPLPEFNRVPEIRTDYVRFLDEASIRSAVEQYITGDNADPMALLPDLRNRIAIAMPGGDGEPMVRYNLTLLYSLSLYLGASAVNRSVERNGRVAFDPRGREVTLLTSLIASLDGEGQHHFINSIVNQLRFPNAHTLFFMLYLLHLFSTAPKSGDVPERITRVLLERILAQRPHPWGLTTAFGELLHNEKLGFWEFPWVRAEPELLEIFKRCALR